MLEMGPLRLHEIAGMRRLGELPPYQATVQVDAWTDPWFWLALLEHTRQYHGVAIKSFAALSDFGGYPACHNNKGERTHLSDLILDTAVKRTFLHDLSAGPGGRRRDRSVLEETFKLVCRHAGRAVRPERIRQEVEQVLGEGVRLKPVTDAIRFLASAWSFTRFHRLKALYKKKSHPPKLCLCDHFIREAWLQEKVPIVPQELANADEAVSTLAGQILESIVGFYLNGIAGLDVSWLPGCTGEPEIDFVLTIGMQRIPVEVKYTRRLNAKDWQGIQSFCA